MFFGGARESTEHHIVIRGIDAAPFQALLEFTRTAQVLIGQENVISLLETADFLQFDRVKLLCEKFLERELHVSNCLGLMTYSQQFAFVELHASAMNVALTHWGDVMCQEEFKALPKETASDFKSPPLSLYFLLHILRIIQGRRWLLTPLQLPGGCLGPSWVLGAHTGRRWSLAGTLESCS
uniref:BTB domain-containing protein n=1 Tax=Anas platyrhynchos platyrhynchos TaxID=8840 RepID=A0A493SSV4_ANAPP